jgi:hypothetical protein
LSGGLCVRLPGRENKAHVLCRLRARRIRLRAPEVDLLVDQLGQRG